MSEKLANRLLTQAETGGTARRYDVGITSVLRRCVLDGIPQLTKRAEVSARDARRPAGEALPPRTPPGYLGTDEVQRLLMGAGRRAF